MRTIFRHYHTVVTLWVAIAVLLPIHNVCAYQPPADPSVVVPAQAPVTNLKAGPLTIEIIPHYNPLAVGATELNVMLRIRADTTTGKRPPLDLAVVLDRSGSMAGDKLRDAKQAALDLLKLLEPQDLVTLITYDDAIIVHETRRKADATGKDQMRAAILSITDGGYTALGPALVEALEIIAAGTRSNDTVAHVALLSDGQANVGETSPKVLGNHTKKAFSQGISVSTLGLGTDYNEELMTRLADQGGGHYYFIKDSNAITGILQEELKSLAATVAHSLVIRMQLTANIKIAKVFGYPLEESKGELSIPVGSMRAGQEREIVIRLSLPPGKPGQMMLGAVTIHARDVRDTGVDVSASGGIATEFSTDAPRIAAGENAGVTIRVAELDALDRVDAATRESDAGRFDSAKAMLQTTATRVRQKANATGSAKLQMRATEIEQDVRELEDAKSWDYHEQRSYGKGKRGRSYKGRK